MRKIEKLRLTQLNKAEMDARQQNALKGGGNGYCLCVNCGCVGGVEVMDCNDCKSTDDLDEGAFKR